MNIRLLRDSLPLIEQARAMIDEGQHSPSKDSAVVHYALALTVVYLKELAAGDPPRRPPLLRLMMAQIAEREAR